MTPRVLALPLEAADWRAVSSGAARLKLRHTSTPCGAGLLLDYDFTADGGFVVARLALDLPLPARWALRVKVRGMDAGNGLELKLIDAAQGNVWWRVWRPLQVTAAWTEWRIPARDFVFAWGPDGTSPPRRLSAIEWAVTGDRGGRGEIALAALELLDLTPPPPRVTASCSAPDFPPDAAFATVAAEGWRVPADRASQAHWWQVDFGLPVDFGGLLIDWPAESPAPAFSVAVGDTPSQLETLGQWPAGGVSRRYLALSGVEARYLRLEFPAGARPALGLIRLLLLPHTVAGSGNALLTEVARHEPRGRWPASLRGEQRYWTVVGPPAGAPTALLEDTGSLEPGPACGRLEPFVWCAGRLYTWADVSTTVALDAEGLPLPSVQWTTDDWTLTVSAWGVATPQGHGTRLRYRLELRRDVTLDGQLCLALRGVQVTPPWQAHGRLGLPVTLTPLGVNETGGTAAGHPALRFSPQATAAGASELDAGDITTWLAAGKLPPTRYLTAGTHLSAGWSWSFALGPDCPAFEVMGEFGTHSPQMATLRATDDLEQTREAWRELLTRVTLTLPPPATRWATTWRSCLAHILLNRNGPALQPGPRRYARAWIRDGAVMAAALLRGGLPAEAAAFVRWYAEFVPGDGAVPCAVDAAGSDPLIEHDSHGEFVFAVAEHARYTGSLALAQTLWPVVQRVLNHLARLSANGERLLPASVSHEGYLAHPVQAYWDDCWALRGLEDGAWLAARLGHATQDAYWSALAARFRLTLEDSLRVVIARHELEHIPASVELADFDPTATANAITLLDQLALFPAATLAATCRRFLDEWRRLRDSPPVGARHTGYDLRMSGLLLRLGWRDEAVALLGDLRTERRPAAWEQWPEILWRDPTTPGHLGDLPHSWVGAEYVLALRDLLVYERGQQLVLAAGVTAGWLGNGEIAVRALPTAFGVIDYSLTPLTDGALRFAFTPRFHAAPEVVQLALPGRWQVQHTLQLMQPESPLTLPPTAQILMIHPLPESD